MTPLCPDGWKLTFGGTASLKPSIGNFQSACEPHYFITSNQVMWATGDEDTARRPEEDGSNRYGHGLWGRAKRIFARSRSTDARVSCGTGRS